MMSAFMFPIYLATNKIQKNRESEEEQKAQLKTEKFRYQERPAVGPDRPERGKANSQ